MKKYLGKDPLRKKKEAYKVGIRAVRPKKAGLNCLRSYEMADFVTGNAETSGHSARVCHKY